MENRYPRQHLQWERQTSRIGMPGRRVKFMLLLAIPFRSYLQPLIVMAAIPFGIIGSVFGHLTMGYNLSLMSMMGIVALSGIVINDSLVLMPCLYLMVEDLRNLLSRGERISKPLAQTE
jgi:Cu/Ag efflux pump CusA